MSAFAADISGLLELLSVKDNANIGPSIVSSVNAEPRKIEPLVAALAEKIASASKGADTNAVGALNAYEALANNCILAAEPFLIHHLPAVLIAAGDKAATVRSAAESAVNAVVTKMSSNSVRQVLPHLFKSSEAGLAWQTRVLALKTIATLSDTAPEQLGHALPEVVPQVTTQMSDTKKEVKEAAVAAMTAACDVIGNRDIEHMTGKIVRSITNPDETPEIMHALAGVTFVQSVQSPALAMVVPLLIRGLRSRVTATRRQSAVIIDNMSKLVDDPIDAAPFLPTLMPALEFAADAMSDPEARKVAENASKQLNRLSRECEAAKAGTKEIDHGKVTEAINAKLPAKANKSDIGIAHTAHLCCSLMSLRKFETADWEEVAKYLAVVCGIEASTKLVAALRVECKDMCKFVPPKDEDDDNAEELCNCQFTLAYGTKILLHNTTMRLKRGHKYGLLGGNDSSKTTLMRAIANGSVENEISLGKSNVATRRYPVTG